MNFNVSDSHTYMGGTKREITSWTFSSISPFNSSQDVDSLKVDSE